MCLRMAAYCWFLITVYVRRHYNLQFLCVPSLFDAHRGDYSSIVDAIPGDAQLQIDLIEHGLTSAPTQYRLYGRRFLQVTDSMHLGPLVSWWHNGLDVRLSIKWSWVRFPAGT